MTFDTTAAPKKPHHLKTHHHTIKSDHHAILKERLKLRPPGILLAALVLLVPRREAGLVHDLLLQHRLEKASQRALGLLSRPLCSIKILV